MTLDEGVNEAIRQWAANYFERPVLAWSGDPLPDTVRQIMKEEFARIEAWDIRNHRDNVASAANVHGGRFGSPGDAEWIRGVLTETYKHEMQKLLERYPDIPPGTWVIRLRSIVSEVR